MKRFSWSVLLSFATLASLGMANGQTRADVDPSVIKARIPSSSGGFRKNWEGFTTTNYLNTEQFLFTPPTAQMASGPTNIITIVNRRIAIFDNPNAIVPVSSTTTGGPTQVRQVLSPTSYLPTNEALLDSWLGEGVLQNLCPTASNSNISCLVDHATVRYDQLHGRYIVAMTVSDTGVETLLSGVTRPRKASWVVLISKFSTFPQFGQTGSSDIFITPTPPGGSTGGVNTTNWSIYYGNSVNGLGTDGFGSLPAGGGQTTGAGNINSIPGVPAAVQDVYFGCSVGDLGNLQVLSPALNRACYFPTSLRIGIDNDNITLVSAVINVNYYIAVSPGPVLIPAFAGNRVRVLKKGGGGPGTNAPAGFYQKSLTQVGLVAGNQFGVTAADRVAGDYYDLYATNGGVNGLDEPQGSESFLTLNEPRTLVNGFALGSPLLLAADNSGTKIISPFTVAPTLGGQAFGVATFCEPARVRGRAAASYTNSLVETLRSSNYLECVISTQVTGGTQNRVYIQPVEYIPTAPINQPSNTNFTIPFYPMLLGDGTTIGTTGFAGMQFAAVDPFSDPSTVPQGNYLGTSGGPAAGTIAPVFYVGDNRVHELVFREGHLYGARVGNALGAFQVNENPLSATVLYDVIQTLTRGNAAQQRNPVLLTKWNNTNAFAPMFDVPANVATAGQAAPINLFPWLEKLFVATTYPQLTASDPRVAEQVGTGTGVAAVTSACTSSNQSPNVIGGISTTKRGYVGLYDMRCGMDVFDALQNFRNPVTGQLMTFIPVPGQTPQPGNPGVTNLPPIVPALRGGASTDPNNGSLWAFGLYANRRFAGVANNGQLGSYIANYDLAFPNTDPYGNTTSFFSDCSSLATCAFFVQVQTAAQLGLALPKAGGNTVGLADNPTRAEMARLVVLSMMDEAGIAAYLNATGGCTTSFADVAPECAGGANTPNVLVTPPANATWRYIETMYRKRITTGCFANDARREFCPTRSLTRGEMAVFIIRAKMNNVYPSVISGCPTPQTPGCAGVVGGDNFGLTVAATPYFTDVTTANAFFVYIQKMYELRITNGTTPPPGAPTFAPDSTLTRGELLTFIVRAFYF